MLVAGARSWRISLAVVHDVVVDEVVVGEHVVAASLVRKDAGQADRLADRLAKTNA